ncbi:NotI family restriction endonuclease [Rufibacter sediminis]|uniref:Restriction endonuclease type II NotI domain-containing protein n=1 Tax=Rufibacter sediminis TaxID=2762756 RepID=A0ABR6VU05_9BACT|nr:NotI family restriction endonuclease [Rufibacter sediminis]MBC3540680.1 hypothetical protein [Rufibacter sediminis]
MESINPRNPLAEIFGFPIHNDTETARTNRDNKFCPFHNGTPKCTKDDKLHPLGVCSMYHKGEPVITCPVRFRENWTMIADAAKFFFGSTSSYLSLSEVRLFDKNGRKAGNIDYVLILHDDRGRIIDFASLEVQAVYISGTIRGAFETFMEDQNPDFEWRGVNYPRPDYLSSSNKRLIPQMLTKGGIFRQWGKKQAVAVQTRFFDTLPNLVEVDPAEADLAWLLYDLLPEESTQLYKLTLNRTVYTKYDTSLFKFTSPEAGDMAEFMVGLQKTVDAKLNGRPSATLDFEGFSEAKDDFT